MSSDIVQASEGEARQMTMREAYWVERFRSMLVREFVVKPFVQSKRKFGDDLYLLQAGENGPYKIGRANNVAERVKTLQTGCPYQIRIISVIHGHGELEHHIHSLCAHHRLVGEWFEPIPEILYWFHGQEACYEF